MSILTPPDIRLFDTLPPETLMQQKHRFLKGLRVIGSSPKTFTWLITDGVSLIFALLLVLTLYNQHSSLEMILGAEALFLVNLVVLVAARNANSFPLVLAYDGAVFILSVLLDGLFPGNWGSFGLLALCGYSCYRLPARQAWPVVAASCLALVWSSGLDSFFITPQRFMTDSPLLTYLLIAAFLCWTGWTRRMRDLLVLQLQETQAQLRKEMAHTEELAANRERTRIARDIHDVLAHSLTMLSVQVQAARQLLQQHPDRLANKLDDIATLLRESIAESRHVVGLMRESVISAPPNDGIETRLLRIIDNFGERTGIYCTFKEEGTPQALDNQQAEALQYALQEALTNAHRHGAAHAVWAVLCWYDARVTLQVDNDGQNSSSDQPLHEDDGGHHGLQGMRERAAALGGELSAGMQAGGFRVLLTLPLVANPRAAFTQEAKA